MCCTEGLTLSALQLTNCCSLLSPRSASTPAQKLQQLFDDLLRPTFRQAGDHLACPDRWGSGLRMDPDDSIEEWLELTWCTTLGPLLWLRLFYHQFVQETVCDSVSTSAGLNHIILKRSTWTKVNIYYCMLAIDLYSLYIYLKKHELTIVFLLMGVFSGGDGAQRPL